MPGAIPVPFTRRGVNSFQMNRILVSDRSLPCRSLASRFNAAADHNANALLPIIPERHSHEIAADVGSL
jgi:hypothetical protein